MIPCGYRKPACEGIFLPLVIPLSEIHRFLDLRQLARYHPLKITVEQQRFNGSMRIRGGKVRNIR